LATGVRRRHVHQHLIMTGILGTPSQSMTNRCVADEYESMVEAMIESDYVKAGYNIISTVCTGWIGRDPVTNVFLENTTPWPRPGGMKDFANYLHSKGLLLAVYSDVGALNCCQEPGSLNYEDLDMATFADRGADIVSVDYSGAPPISTEVNYQQYVDGITKSSNLDMQLTIFNLGKGSAQDWAPRMKAPFFRCTADISNAWHTVGITLGIIEDLNNCLNTPGLTAHTGIENGTYPMFGQLSVGVPKDHPTSGDPGLTLIEAQTEFSVWCILPAPLYATNDVRERDPDVEAILLNPEAIAINQDVLGLAATQLNASVPNQMQFVKKLANGDIAVVVMNYDDTMTQKGTELVFADFLPSTTMQYSVRDVARRVNDGFACTKVTLGDLAPHESAFLRFTLTNKTC
jgi:alpha-galactosidase